MQINDSIYPYNPEVKKLPVHLTGIGGSEYQYHLIRNEGYLWHQILLSAFYSLFSSEQSNYSQSASEYCDKFSSL